MKIIGLLAFKNEEAFLRSNLPQLSDLCDVLLGHDDNSVDKSRDIFMEFGGVLIPQARSLDWANGGQFQVRHSLLKFGRAQGGTHFICLDADEIFSSDVAKDLRDQIANLSPGSALCLKWINCWTHPDDKKFAYDPKAVIYKDFVFADAEGLEIPYGMIHFSRTPTSASSHVRSASEGGVLHLQNYNYENFVAKQLWYQLSEMLFNNYPYFYVEHKYLYFTKKPNGLVSLEPKWIEDLPQLNTETSLSVHWKMEIFKVLTQLKDQNLQYLKLWEHPFLGEIYNEFYGARPAVKSLLRLIYDRARMTLFVSRSWIASWRAKNFR